MDDTIENQVAKIRSIFKLAKEDFDAIMDQQDTEVFSEPREVLDVTFPRDDGEAGPNPIKVIQDHCSLKKWMKWHPVQSNAKYFHLAVPMMHPIEFRVEHYAELGGRMQELMAFVEEVPNTFVPSVAHGILEKAATMMVDMHACLAPCQQALANKEVSEPSDASVAALASCEQAFQHLAQTFPENYTSLQAISREGPGSCREVLAGAAVRAIHIFVDGNYIFMGWDESSEERFGFANGFRATLCEFKLNIYDKWNKPIMIVALPSRCQLFFRSMDDRSLGMAAHSAESDIRYLRDGVYENAGMDALIIMRSGDDRVTAVTVANAFGRMDPPMVNYASNGPVTTPVNWLFSAVN